MAYKIQFELPKRDLGKVDLVLDIDRGSNKLGELRISKGGIDWWPRYKKTKKISFSWRRFAALIESSSGRKRRKAVR